jgi:hypothetical protein
MSAVAAGRFDGSGWPSDGPSKVGVPQKLGGNALVRKGHEDYLEP